jgi:hypothetical protein
MAWEIGRRQLCWFSWEFGYRYPMKKSAKMPRSLPLKARENEKPISKQNQLYVIPAFTQFELEFRETAILATSKALIP